jgi:hypothetical protein
MSSRRLHRIACSVSFSLLASTSQAAVTPPRIFLDPATLTTLVQRAKAGTPEWKALHDTCKRYLTGTVNWPDGDDYPDGGNIGEGYQGTGYFISLMNVGLCYRVSLDAVPAEASQYAAKGVDILTKMSAPSGSHSPDTLRDSGYGIRFYGLGMAVGYDWLRPALSASLKTRVVTAINRWIDDFESGGFERDFPQGNYFAGYYAAKGIAALSTEGDNTAKPTLWQDWLTLHQTKVQPYYAANLTGGGWPEGWNYGPVGTLNMVWPMLAAKSAKNLDLINTPNRPYVFPLNTAKFITHFAWPNRLSMDDSCAVYDSDNPTPTQPFLFVVEADVLKRWNSPFAPYAHSFARTVRSVQQAGLEDPGWDLWINFLFWDDTAPENDYHGLPLSYYAQGIENAAVRSSWKTNAVWAAFKGGPYINYPENGEEYFDKGSLAIMNGNKPLIVNATGALLRNTPGTTDGSDFYQPLYDDNFGDGGQRDIYNIFYTGEPTPWGQGNALRADGARTRMRYFEDKGSYVFMEAWHLEDEYPRYSGLTATLSAWTRDVIYLRPGTFVVYDRATVTDPSIAQWMQFHVRQKPVAATASVAGVKRWDIGSGTGYAGTVQTVLPVGHADSIVDLFNGHKVYRLAINRPTDSNAKTAQWLTVIDAAATAQTVPSAQRLSAADGSIEQGAVVGVLLQGATANQAVLAGTGQAAPSGTIRYRVPAVDTAHVLTGFKLNTRYAVTVTQQNGKLSIAISEGNGVKTSTAGVLAFRTTATGDLQ